MVQSKDEVFKKKGR